MTSVAVVIPAYNEAERVGETVTAALTLPSVDAVVVASDGSTDATVRVAMDADATVWRSRRNQGKAAAMLAGAAYWTYRHLQPEPLFAPASANASQN